MARTRVYDQLRVEIFDTSNELAQAAAEALRAIVRQALTERGEAALILATGNSQRAFYQQLRSWDDIAWGHVTLFHMDEYLGIDEHHPASFRRVLHDQLVDALHPRAFHGIQGDAEDVEAELERYGALLAAQPPIACVMGIGENGHLAFNDPPADFTTARTIQVVDLVESCRQQQVGEGHFARLEEVPLHAISLTIPALLAPPHMLVIAPEERKAVAVRAALDGPLTPDCPASILRTAPHARLFLDRASADLLETRG